MAKFARPAVLLPLCLVLGWSFDFLFWGKPVGISFPIFVLLLLAAGFWMASHQNLKPARSALWLLIPIAFFSLVPAVRTEPLTVFLSIGLALVLLLLLASTYLDGRWPRYGFVDYFIKLVGLIPLGWLAMREGQPTGRAKRAKPAWGVAGTILRGLLFALPLLLLLAALLSSADSYFAEWLSGLFTWVDISPELILRGIVILILAYVLAGVYMFALARSRKQALIGEDKPVVAPFLGWGEAITMLVSVNLLFLAFVVVQFRYFFGGLSNIVAGTASFTFAEYARRGFAELVVVAVVALGFFILLSTVSQRKPGSQQRWFSGLGIGLFAMVAVILVSAFERLLLLEEAYGFTRFRTYPHVFMIWLGVLLLAVVVLEALRRQRAFALAMAVAIVGFVATLVFWSDGFITRTNIERAQTGSRLDFLYLSSLSAEAVPGLISGYREASAAGDNENAESLAIALACYFAEESDRGPIPWQGWNLAVVTAQNQWAELKRQTGFPAYVITKGRVDFTVTINGETTACAQPYWD